jgi:phosphotriesterase-related protein
MTSEMTGKVQTVLGPVDPSALGPTVTHEHLLIDLRPYFTMPQEATARADVDRPFTLDMVGRGRSIFLYNYDHMTLLDEGTAVDEIGRYALWGGGSLVDATSIGIARDPRALARISRATGLNIVMGASHYVPLTHPADMSERSEARITGEIVKDLTEGVGDTGIKSGIIGEIGCWNPMSENVEKVLRASVVAQKETGAPILIHPPFTAQGPGWIVDILQRAGADMGRVIMGHLDYVLTEPEQLLELAKSGCYLEWDLLGNEDTSGSPIAPMDRVNDDRRLANFRAVIDAGYGERIVVAHDVCTKGQLVSRGGKGYAHLLENVVPRMRRSGFTEPEIENIVVSNPARILTWA